MARQRRRDAAWVCAPEYRRYGAGKDLALSIRLLRGALVSGVAVYLWVSHSFVVEHLGRINMAMPCS